MRIPVVARPEALAAPMQGSGNYSVTFGHTGAFTAKAPDLVPTTTFNGAAGAPNPTIVRVDVP